MPRTELGDFDELAHFELDRASIRMLPLAYCARNRIAVLGRVDRDADDPVTVGMSDGKSLALLGALEASWGRPVRPVRLADWEIDKALDVGFLQERTDASSHVLDVQTPLAHAGADTVALVDDVLLHAIAKRASDVHLECYRDDVDVRLRIDGVLHQLAHHFSPDSMREAASRIKILAKLDIAERRRPQDGRFRSAVVDGARLHEVDFRVSVLPGPAGEDVVLRVLDTSVGLLAIRELGMDDATRTRFERLLENPEGTVLVTGPTGSGKTTTLYSALVALRDGTRKIITAEDPIEYQLAKINQKQVSSVTGMADLARAFLRQDPDVMLIGEIRDHATAATAAKAATTGHLVLGTLHTSDALGAIPRLRGLGLEDDEIGNSMLAVLAQRLVRKICHHCSESAPLNEAQRERLGALSQGLSPRRGAGCPLCHGSGYSGRVGVFELWVIDHPTQDAIARGTPTSGLRDHLHQNDHRSLVVDMLSKVAAGVTTVDEVFRTIPYRQLEAERRWREVADTPDH
jgi:general secretion pathway protein E/type IV pilus assembly protein PilB